MVSSTWLTKQRKAALFARVMGGGAPATTMLGPDDVRALFES